MKRFLDRLWYGVVAGIALISLGLWLHASRAENSVGPTNLILCNKIATQAVGVSSITQMIAPVAGTTIIMCGWDVSNTGATGTFSFQSGTGSNCGTGTNTFVPALNITSTAPAVDRQQYATIQLPQGAALCITPSVATIAAVVWYATIF